MTKLIPRNSTVPTRCTHYFTTAVDNQEAVTVQIFEGERRMTKDCHKLGEFTLENLPKMGRGVPQIEVVLSVDGDGILQVRATETSVGGDGVAIEITNDRGQLSSEDIETLIKDKIQKEIDKIVHNWADEGIRVEKGRWGRHNIIKGKIKIELPKTVDAVKLTLEEVKSIIETKSPKKATKKRSKKK